MNTTLFKINMIATAKLIKSAALSIAISAALGCGGGFFPIAAYGWGGHGGGHAGGHSLSGHHGFAHGSGHHDALAHGSAFHHGNLHGFSHDHRDLDHRDFHGFHHGHAPLIGFLSFSSSYDPCYAYPYRLYNDYRCGPRPYSGGSAFAPSNPQGYVGGPSTDPTARPDPSNWNRAFASNGAVIRPPLVSSTEAPEALPDDEKNKY